MTCRKKQPPTNAAAPLPEPIGPERLASPRSAAAEEVIMQPSQALALGLVLIDYEIEEPSCVPTPPEWKKELNAAREILSELIGLFERLPARDPEPTDWQALPEVLTVPQAAKAAKVHRSTMGRFIRERRIRAAKVSGRYQIDREDLRAAIETGILSAQKGRKRARPNRQSHPTLGF